MVDNLVDSVTVDDIVEVNVVDVFVVSGGEGDILTVDGVNIDNGWGDNSSDDFPDVVKGKVLQDAVKLRGDSLGDEETLEEGFLDNDVFNIGGVVVLGGGDDLLVNLDVNDL